MPEYLAPGVYVEETSFRAKSIEGVGTSTTAFIGPTRKGPLRASAAQDEPLELLVSFADYERLYGGLADLRFAGADAGAANYLAHAVRAYFNEGGSRLYVARVFVPGGAADDGRARASVIAGPDDETVRFVARMPGAVGNGRVEVREIAAPATARTLDTAPAGSLLRAATGAGDPPAAQYYLKVGTQWRRTTPAATEADATPVATLTAANANAQLLTLAVIAADADGDVTIHDDMGFDPAHRRYVGAVMSESPARRVDHLENLYAIVVGANVSALELRNGLFPSAGPTAATVGDDGFLRAAFALAGGNDGAEPNEAAYALGFDSLRRLEDVAIVAAPGSSSYADAAAIRNALIGHAEARRAYRIAVLDTPPDMVPSGARQYRAEIDSKYAALYYPWVTVSNPLARPGQDNVAKELALPPSGFVCGIYARNDIERGVHKAPANEVVRGALRFERDVSFGEQELLNPLGVNCLRYLSGRGFRVWGARTASSDPEWKYVNVRRYFNYLEASIDRGTQWAVFEPNGERLWANVRQTIGDFLYNEWRGGALLGATTEEAYFVRCDRSTMTQNDLDNGRLVCLIGVAALKPAEFVIFRIGQKTADARQ